MPETMELRPGISVGRGRYNDMGVPHRVFVEVALDDNEWAQYKREAEKAIAALESKPTGLALVQALSATKKGVVIGTPTASGRGSVENSCVVLGPAQYYPMLASPADLQNVLLAAHRHIARGQLTLPSPFQLQIMDVYRAIQTMVEALATVRWAQSDKPWEARWAMATLAWKPDCEPIARYLFERFLMPGGGVTSVVRWDPSSTSFAKAFGGRSHDSAGAVARRGAAIGLGHELVHAWRGATGRGIFAPGAIEDEHMTVGLALPTVRGDLETREIRLGPGHQVVVGPLVDGLRHGLASQRLTENALRAESGEPMRPIY